MASARFSSAGIPLSVAYTLRAARADSARASLALLFTHPFLLVRLLATRSPPYRKFPARCLARLVILRRLQ